jgi:hypothetical protein
MDVVALSGADTMVPTGTFADNLRDLGGGLVSALLLVLVVVVVVVVVVVLVVLVLLLLVLLLVVLVVVVVVVVVVMPVLSFMRAAMSHSSLSSLPLPSS